jgi:hypothetical protein
MAPRRSSLREQGFERLADSGVLLSTGNSHINLVLDDKFAPTPMQACHMKHLTYNVPLVSSIDAFMVSVTPITSRSTTY